MDAADGKRRRVLVITERFWPEPNFITADVAERLAREADVTVVAPHPSYPRGRFYEGTRWWRPVRTVERGCTVWRVPFFPNQSLSSIRRAASYLSFALVAALTAPIVARDPDVVWVYHGPFTAGLAALWFRVVRRARLVITAADLWPESFTGAGVAPPGMLMRALHAYSRWINSFAHHIICSTEGTAHRYAADGMPADRLTVVPVWIPGVQDMTPDDAAAASTSHDVVYTGNLGPAQQLDTLLRAAVLLSRDVPSVQVHLYGSGVSEQELRNLAQELGATNVHFHGRVTADEAFHRASAAAVQVVSLRRSPAFRATVPSKLSQCFAAATPFVYGLEGEAAEVARKSGGGVPFDPDDPRSLAEAIRSILRLPHAE
ncbi:MAG TPA: glycosyltransferase family 4 protein, partial [Gemmatimonadaceae bacterium]|nr:glycosyltransferase family 4 protein [Gemmatimonadaceae bacterium]